MYVPSSFAESDVPTLFAFMEAHPLATLVTNTATGLFATHLPLVIDRGAGPNGTLMGHIARANPHARLVTPGATAFTRMRYGASSRAMPRVKPTIPSLLAIYAVARSDPR